LPATISELVIAWVEADRARARRHFMRNPLSRLTLGKLTRGRDWSKAAVRPHLVESTRK
jgi:hypothetical protein